MVLTMVRRWVLGLLIRGVFRVLVVLLGWGRRLRIITVWVVGLSRFLVVMVRWVMVVKRGLRCRMVL